MLLSGVEKSKMTPFAIPEIPLTIPKSCWVRWLGRSSFSVESGLDKRYIYSLFLFLVVGLHSLKHISFLLPFEQKVSLRTGAECMTLRCKSCGCSFDCLMFWAAQISSNVVCIHYLTFYVISIRFRRFFKTITIAAYLSTEHLCLRRVVLLMASYKLVQKMLASKTTRIYI